MEKFYSFYIGSNGSPKSTWILDDCKLRAYDVKEALIMHSFHKEYLMNSRERWLPNKNIYTSPDPWYIKHTYRRVLEYEKKDNPKYGRTLVQFKELKKYSQHEILTYFKEIKKPS